MSRTYKATGINLKSIPLGESDRLLTVLTREVGLVRAVAPGSRKPKSKLGGRSSLFVVNELLLAKGRSLDKITQAETLESYPGLSRDLAKLTASQYLAELVLCQALSEQPQEELFWLLCEHLSRLERLPLMSGDHSPTLAVLAYLAHAIFHLLAWAGIAPQVHACCITQRFIAPDFIDPSWRVGFSVSAGGIVSLAESEASKVPALTQVKPILPAKLPSNPFMEGVRKPASVIYNHDRPEEFMRLSALELQLLQQLAQPNLLQVGEPLPTVQTCEDSDVAKQSYSQSAWLSVERVLRQYAQYHFDRPIRSAALMDTCFHPLHHAPLAPYIAPS